MTSITNLRKDITLTAVCSKGYNDRDMTSYYGGTFLIRNEKDVLSVVYVHSAVSTAVLLCEYLDSNNHIKRDEVLTKNLYRFTPCQGYYKIGKSFGSYSLPTTRSYKKGINRELLKIQYLSGDNIDHIKGQLRSLMEICSAPEKQKRGDDFILSQRLLVIDGKIHSFYRHKTVGSYADGILTTPFVSIIDRVNQLYGDIQCQLQIL